MRPEAQSLESIVYFWRQTSTSRCPPRLFSCTRQKHQSPGMILSRHAKVSRELHLGWERDRGPSVRIEITFDDIGGTLEHGIDVTVGFSAGYRRGRKGQATGTTKFRSDLSKPFKRGRPPRWRCRM